VLGKLEEPMSGVSELRNSAGRGNMAMYIVGVLAFGTGVYLATITRINLLTGQSTSPYLPAGIALIICGAVLALGGRALAKRRLVR
jgi:hypothetical protein